MWQFVWLAVAITSQINGNVHHQHTKPRHQNLIDDIVPNDDFDLDYSHNIFIPFDAYDNYEKFLEYAERSDLAKRGGVTSLPAIQSLPGDGSHTYAAPGVNCQVQLLNKKVEGTDKRVIERTSCAEGWTLKNALGFFFAGVGHDLATKSAGLVHMNQLRFKMLIFEAEGYTFVADTDNEVYSNLQSKLSLKNAECRLTISNSYTFENSEIVLTGNHEVIEKITNAKKTLEVTFEKGKDTSSFDVKMKVPSMPLETFATIFLESETEFITADMGDTSYEINIDPIKAVIIESTSNSVTGVFDGSDGKFQLTGKFLSNDQNAFMGQATDIYLTVNRKSLGSRTTYNLMLGFAKEVKVMDIIPKYVGKTEIQDEFDDNFLKNTIEKWHLLFTSKRIIVADGAEYKKTFANIFDADEYQEFKQGVGIKATVDLQKTLTACSSGSTVPDSLKSVKIKGLLGRRGLSMVFPPGTSVPLIPLIKCKLRQIQDDLGFELPISLKGYEQKSKFKLEEIAYSSDSGAFKMSLLYENTITIYKDVLEITNPQLTIEREGKDEPWQFTIAADVSIFQVDASVMISYSKTGYTVEVSSGNVPLTNLLRAFSFSDKPAITFEIHDFKMQIEVKDKEEEEENEEEGEDEGNKNQLAIKRQDNKEEKKRDLKFSIAGKPVFNGFDKVSIEALVWTSQTPAGVAVAVVMENIRLDEVLEKILDVPEVPMAWFSDMTLTMVISNVDAEGCDNPAQSEDDCEEADEEEEEEEEGEGEEEEGEEGEKDGKEKNGKDGDKSKKKIVDGKKSSRVVKKASKTSNKKIVQKGRTLKKKNQVKGEAKQKLAKGRALISKRSDGEEEGGEGEAEEEEEGGDFSLSHLSQVDLVRGLQVSAEFALPGECKKDKLCEWMKTKLGQDTKLTIEGTFSRSGFTLAAGITTSLELAKDLSLTEAKLELEFTKDERSVALSCTLKYNNKELSGKEGLEFIGTLKVSFSGELEISMQMKGMVYEPFGVEKLAFGNIFLSLGVTIAGGLPSFQIGAKIMIGKGVKNKGGEGVFIFEGYFGFNPADPTDNYIYAKRSGDPLTIGNFIKNFEIEATVPKKIANSGFYGETIISFSAAGKKVDELDLEIEAGFYFKGALKILDFDIYAELKVNPDPENRALFANITLSPLNWVMGLLRISRSKDDDKNGPFLIVDIDSEKTAVQFEGFGYCLGIGAEIAVVVNETHFYFHFAGDLFTVLHASLTVESAYGGDSISDMSFSFKGCVGLDLRKIADIVFKTMQDASKAVSLALGKARKKVENARGAVTAAFDKVRQWRQGIESYKARLRARSAELERKKKELNYSCRDRCGKVCVGFLDWNPYCWKVWNTWHGCPKWNPCRWKVDDIICIAGCELKKGWNKFVTWAEQVGIQIMLGLSEVAQFLLKGVEAFEKVAQGVLTFAVGVLNVVESFAKGVLAGVGAIVKAASNVIVIERFCLSGNLKPVESACVGIDAKFSIFKVPIEWKGEFCIDLNFFQIIGKKTAVKHTPAIAEIDSKVQEFESQGNEIDSKVGDMKDEESKQGNEVETETEKPYDINRRKRSHVPTAEEVYFHKLAYDRLPKVNTRSFETETSMKDGAPWILSKTWKPSKRNVIKEESTLEKRILKTDSPDHCKNIENLYSNYQNIAEGFGTFLKNADKQKAGFQAMKRSYIDGMNYLKDEFNYGDKRQNVTDEEREHVKYWEEYVNKGLTSHIEDTESLLKAQRKTYIPSFRKQVNQLFMEQTKSTLPTYINKMKNTVIKSYHKRSDIPKEHMERQLRKWNNLHEALGEIASSETASYWDLSQHVASVNYLLTNLRRSDIPCAA